MIDGWRQGAAQCLIEDDNSLEATVPVARLVRMDGVGRVSVRGWLTRAPTTYLGHLQNSERCWSRGPTECPSASLPDFDTPCSVPCARADGLSLASYGR